MKIQLEEKNKLLCLLPGFCQLVQNDPFTPCALGLTETELIIYNDYWPDEIHTDVYLYRIKKRIPLADIKTILNQSLKHSRNLEYYHRLNIIAKVVELSSFIYYRKSDASIAKNMLKIIKTFGITVKKDKVSMESNS